MAMKRAGESASFDRARPLVISSTGAAKTASFAAPFFAAGNLRKEVACCSGRLQTIKNII